MFRLFSDYSATHIVVSVSQKAVVDRTDCCGSLWRGGYSEGADFGELDRIIDDYSRGQTNNKVPVDVRVWSTKSINLSDAERPVTVSSKESEADGSLLTFLERRSTTETVLNCLSGT